MCAAHAEQRTVRLGAALVRFDGARWATSETTGAVYFNPQGEAARKLDAVELRRIPDDGVVTCETHATRAFGLGQYDLGSIVRTPMSVGNIAGERFTAHTRCRNATPRGEVACARVANAVYLMVAVNDGCQGNNLFSGIEPLGEIAAGMAFDAASSAP
ncbi:MAG: hypothetical protein Q8K85_24265 [Hyphomicrobium sp.]|nr:hypothetical protein [Hyphomicrobium sp.]